MRNKREAQSLMGHLNFVRMLVSNFAKIAKPIFDVTKGNSFKWTDTAEKSHQKLIDVALKSGQLARRMPDKALDIEIETDETSTTIVCKNEGEKNTICFFTDTKVAIEKSLECGSAGEVLPVLAKRLLSLKAVAREQPIIVNMLENI